MLLGIVKDIIDLLRRDQRPRCVMHTCSKQEAMVLISCGYSGGKGGWMGGGLANERGVVGDGLQATEDRVLPFLAWIRKLDAYKGTQGISHPCNAGSLLVGAK